MKQIPLSALLTDEEIEHASKLYVEHAADGKFASIVDQEVISPVLHRINEATGQENDSRYLAYALEAAFAGLL